MQFLFDVSEERGEHAGLGLVRGRVVRFPQNGLVVPHMGWNQIEPTRAHPLLAGIAPGSYSYFVHSYYCQPTDAAAILATIDYGSPFTAIIAQDNIYGSQFHPEKSRKYMGVERSTFLIDGKGRDARVWRKVKVPGHAGEVLSAVEAMPR